MTLRQLTYFLAVVEEGSITRAAQRLHVSQPSLSQQIRRLETTLGGALVERLPRSVRLTPFGRQFEGPARAVVLAAERAERVARAALGTQTGELEIATVRSIAVGILPRSITRLRAAHPGVSVRLHEFGHRATLEERVRSGLADVAIGPCPQRWDGPLERLGWEEFVVVLPRDDPAVEAGARVRLASLRDREWGALRPRARPQRRRDVRLRHRGVPAAAGHPDRTGRGGRGLAAAGLGPALLPGDAVPPDLAEAALRLDPPLGREIAAYARHALSAVAGAYLGLLREDACWSPRPPDLVAVP